MAVKKIKTPVPFNKAKELALAGFRGEIPLSDYPECRPDLDEFCKGEIAGFYIYKTGKVVLLVD